MKTKRVKKGMVAVTLTVEMDYNTYAKFIAMQESGIDMNEVIMDGLKEWDEILTEEFADCLECIKYEQDTSYLETGYNYVKRVDEIEGNLRGGMDELTKIHWDNLDKELQGNNTVVL